jgi:hypothetical protein
MSKDKAKDKHNILRGWYGRFYFKSEE